MTFEQSIIASLAGWMPLTQAAVLGLSTFVQEDLSTISAALLAAAGKLNWRIGFFGCYLGIWIGDAMLYAMARFGGRPLLKHSFAKRFFDPESVAGSEEWFKNHGKWVLFTSRFVPGTRLPAYLAAGFLRLPFYQFLLITGLAVGLWTVAIFSLAKIAGPQMLHWLARLKTGSWALLGAIILGFAGLYLLRKFFILIPWRHIHTTIARWSKWEFWPPWLFYAPVALNYVRLAIRHGCFTLPTASNPGIEAGGFVGESKIAILRQLMESSPEFTAEAFLLETGPLVKRLTVLKEARRFCRIEYPYVLKPDVGQRGLGFKIIRNPEQEQSCLEQHTADLVVQRYAPGPKEAGVFYYRFPHEQRGRILAITEKLFPEITGDGQRTVEELVMGDPRARLIAAKYLRRLRSRRSEVLPAGTTLKLVEAGNHAQGCIFREGGHLWSQALEERIDAISQKINGFFIGRYDIRYASDEDLRAGQNFTIVELNGATSEDTSIYDSRNSIATAYRRLFRQWELVFAIGAANRQQGAEVTSLRALWRMWREGMTMAPGYALAD